MMQFNPSLIVNRLIITKSGKHVYDEKFNTGVNVIRGKNSSGKSTISDFLFYGLGGELTKWKDEAKSCDFVFVE
jgi:DNA repair exonuclease SbcCD ATPase subunit